MVNEAIDAVTVQPRNYIVPFLVTSTDLERNGLRAASGKSVYSLLEFRVQS
jgi:hypothetical protein